MRRRTSKPNPRNTNGHRRRQARAKVLARDHACGICGAPIDKTIKLDHNGKPHPLSPEVDEIIPISKGGSPYDVNNLQLAHRICNQRKGNKTNFSFQSPRNQSQPPQLAW